jgi:UV DNA damage endonuclease
MDLGKNNFGYCCLCLSLEHEGVTTNRGMVKRTFLERGLPYVSELALKNTEDLVRIIEWNASQNISMYRMSSDIFPWCSEYEFSELPHISQIKENLKKAGDLAISSGMRLSFHPSPYCVIASMNPDVVIKSIKELRQHGEIMDMMGLPQNHFYPINIHVNTSKPTKEESAERFCNAFYSLPDPVKKRLVIENDGCWAALILANMGGYRAITKAGGEEFATSMHLWFDQGVEAFRLTFRMDGQPVLSAAITPPNSAVTRSHFATIAVRT